MQPNSKMPHYMSEGGEKMQQANELRERMIQEFAENYMEKLFYFCLKKTGNQVEAEDLTQEIALQIIGSLNKGTIPTSFSGWVWQIARNCYAKWATEKHRRQEAISGSDIGDYEIEDTSESILDEMIHTEQMSLLRRELAFIKSDYRNIVVAYYIENKSIRQIASALSLPENTVKSRLFRAREILKEGMDMAREFGKRSYKPEEIAFTNSCSAFGDCGQPWNILQHAMYKNIFLEAYGNPSTAEELSIELGIALPYMEDELEYLTKQTFLVKRENKYETSFPIIGKDVQEKIWYYNSGVAERLTTLFEQFIDQFSKACEGSGISYYGKYTTYEDAKWALLMAVFDTFARTEYDGKFEYTKRPDNGRWDIVGYQGADIPYLPWVGLHGAMNSSVPFSQYKFNYKNIESNTPSHLSPEEANILKSVAEGNWEQCSQALLDKLLKYGYIRKKDERYEPAIVVFNMEEIKVVNKFSESEVDAVACAFKEVAQIAKEIKRIISDAKNFAFKLTADSLPPLFKNDERMCYFACRNSMLGRDLVLDQAIKHGWIKYDENTSKVIGAYICI